MDSEKEERSNLQQELIDRARLGFYYYIAYFERSDGKIRNTYYLTVDDMKPRLEFKGYTVKVTINKELDIGVMSISWS